MHVITDKIRQKFMDCAAIGSDSECWPWSGPFHVKRPVIYAAPQVPRFMKAVDVARFVFGLPNDSGRYNHRACGNLTCVNPYHCGPAAEMFRFWRKVNKTESCWEWSGGKSPAGYGTFSIRDTDPLYAHRVAYEALVGPIPSGLDLDHLCRNRGCVNPAHLEPVTRKVNILRGESIMAKNARKTHCRRGHEFTPENTRIRANGRNCRACDRIHEAHRNRCTAE